MSGDPLGESPAEIGFGNYGHALGVLECGDPGADVGAFAEHVAIPPCAPGAHFTPGVS